MMEKSTAFIRLWFLFFRGSSMISEIITQKPLLTVGTMMLPTIPCPFLAGRGPGDG
jgi:hypothetical protein